ncbi:MAG: general secretion pathway protein GspB [Pseudomonadota bacterium]
MSTILKALKQAEKDSPEQGGKNRPSFKVRTAISSQMHQQKKQAFLSMGRIVFFAVLVLGTGLICFPFFYKNQTIQSQTPPAEIHAEASDTPPGTAKDLTQPLNTLTESSELPEVLIEKPLQPVIPSPHEPELPPEEPALTPELPEEPALTPEPEAESKTIPASNPSLSMALFDNLRVQAISWASEPANRIAVIDNKVLKEGDSFDGYRLVTIEKDTVILHYSGQDYRLGFKYR